MLAAWVAAILTTHEVSEVIDEQHVFYVRIGRWEEQSDFYEIHKIGVDRWLSPIQQLLDPPDYRTKSLIETIAAYMESNEDYSMATLLRSSVRKLLADARTLAVKALQESKNKAELTKRMRFCEELGKMHNELQSQRLAIAGMVASYRDEYESWQEEFDGAVNYLRKIGNEVPECSPISQGKIITKQQLAKMIGKEAQTINAHMNKGLVALNPGGNPVTFSFEVAKEFYKTRGIDLQ